MTAALLLLALLVLILGELRGIIREKNTMRNGPKSTGIHHPVGVAADAKMRQASENILKARALLIVARKALGDADMKGLAARISAHEEKLDELVTLIDAASFPEAASSDRPTVPAERRRV